MVPLSNLALACTTRHRTLLGAALAHQSEASLSSSTTTTYHAWKCLALRGATVESRSV
eukprot:CAMPEP_0203909860 /NCGR_PEP_ID=MMETSP0359-20131031/51121_1 /ASSEMBLY_ACC=CAM_ASM_000338 /TAXON_ID=268821 /ORGANISM="Scrippsiella Hangoei, Strain SHTV-5" /LENGTH=57 /DNA_ID=CAMNT_0050835187 /DNA_START=613 /DNA_END=786 /DNA_ORIENTATION=+